MNLHIVVPFHRGDAARATAMLDWCADLCGQQDRTCILAHEELTPSADVQRAASRAFTKVEHLHVTSAADGWPISANCYFGGIAFAMRQRGPWLLMEPDCVFIKPNTIPLLETDYERCGKANLGAIIPAYFQRNGEWQEVGQMLAGVAIYHPRLWDNSPLLRCLRATQNAYAKANMPPKAFDCYLAPEILPHAGSTHLIQHMGKSREFRRAGREILCTYGPESRWDPMIQPETALVHGVKDGSLIALLRAELNLPAGTYAPQVEAPIVKTAPVRREVAELQWGADDSLPPEPAPAVPPPRPPETSPLQPPFPIVGMVVGQPLNTGAVTRPPLDKEAAATLLQARNAIGHWPECKAHVFGLSKARGRYRVICECGASSAKLPEGVDWEAVWSATATAIAEPAPKIVTPHEGAVGLPIIAPSTEQIDSAEPTAKTEDAVWDSLLLHEGGRIGPFRARETVDYPNALPDIRKSAEAIGMKVERLKIERSPGAEEQKPAISPMEAMKAKMAALHAAPSPDIASIPLAQIKTKRDILARFPQWSDLTPKQIHQRFLHAKKKEHEKSLEPLKAHLAKAAGRLLTEEARKRKLELVIMGKGRPGAVIKLRRHAESLGLRHTKEFPRDCLIAFILEKEFQAPYEEFAEAV